MDLWKRGMLALILAHELKVIYFYLIKFLKAILLNKSSANIRPAKSGEEFNPFSKFLSNLCENHITSSLMLIVTFQ